ncbi:hypothetical protein [Crateriforma conspicua]|uniref:Uncharacterized protein n=1 Tax=Crateriforma conspicua TaxID=2527996 RepID=A0A5C6FFR1_9PLAN|nr:hypothetical protein [Crateriforma conspicua]TWU59597.1 hypothetical protein V7x_55070 [Crateriforma conspicua]
MNVSLNDARQLLESQLAPLDEHVARLESELAEVTESRNRMRAALTALAGTPDKAKSRTDRPNIDANLLVQLFEQFLRDNGSLSVADLDGLVRAKAKELGYSLAGYGPCKKSALNNPQFEKDAESRVTLRQPSCGLRPEVA